MLEVRDYAVGELARAVEVTAPCRLLELRARVVELLLELLRLGVLALLGLPLRGERGRLLLEFGQVLLQLAEPFARCPIVLLLKCLAFDLELHDPAIELVDCFGLEVDHHTLPGRGLVDQVDRFVGQEAVRDVAMAEGRRGDDRAVGDPHAMVQLVLLLEAAQDRDGVLDRGLSHEHRLEAPGEGRVLLDVLAVLVERGGADAVQLAARERGLQHV